MPRNKKPKVLVILGPTASGKSDLAVFLAKKFNGEVISADSRQVYKGMDIGSGKITKKEQQGIKHYCLDIASPKRQFSVAQFQKKAKKAINDILKRDKLPIVCGGTNFWVKALAEDFSLPQARPNLKLRKELNKKSADRLYEMLKNLDKNRAKTIEKQNKRRLIRAIEIAINQGYVPPLKTKNPYSILKLAIKIDKNTLKEKISQRLDARLKKGLVKEVKSLKNLGLSWQKLENFGLEYKWLALYLQDKISYQEMKEKLKTDIWHFARKQISWLKNKEKNLVWITNKNQAEKLVKDWLNKK